MPETPEPLFLSTIIPAAMTSVPAMHEEVHSKTGPKKEDRRQLTHDMRLVLLPQEVSADGQEDQQTQAVSESQGAEKSWPAGIL